MPTDKHRINISVSQEMSDTLSELAKRDRVPTARKAAELLRLGLEIHEDIALDELAHARVKESKKRISHEAMWGR